MTQTLLHVNGRLVGIVADNELTQRRRARVHMLRKPAGWAVDNDVLRQAQQLGAVRVRIVDIETGVEYLADIADFYRHGRHIDFGHGAQTALPLRHWRKQTVDTTPAARDAGMVQAALFA